MPSRTERKKDGLGGKKTTVQLEFWSRKVVRLQLP